MTKNSTDISRNEYVFRLWQNHKLSFKQIAQTPIPGFLSLKSVKNIVYAGPARLNTDYQKKVYSAFRMKFLEIKDVSMAILHTYENQPTRHLAERTIRKIITNELIKRRNPANTQRTDTMNRVCTARADLQSARTPNFKLQTIKPQTS